MAFRARSLKFLIQRQYRIGVASTIVFYNVLKINGLFKSLFILSKKILYAPLHPLYAWLHHRAPYKRTPHIYFTQSLMLLVRSAGHLSGFYKIFTQ